MHETHAEDASKTIRYFKATRRQTHLVDWPGYKHGERQVPILYLSCRDQQTAYFEARKHFEKLNQTIDAASLEQFNLEFSYQLVRIMLLEPGSENPALKLFPTTDKLREELTPNEVDYFIDEHETFQKLEVAEWSDINADPSWRKLARVLGLDEGLTSDELINYVANMRTDGEE